MSKALETAFSDIIWLTVFSAYTLNLTLSLRIASLCDILHENQPITAGRSKEPTVIPQESELYLKGIRRC